LTCDSLHVGKKISTKNNWIRKLQEIKKTKIKIKIKIKISITKTIDLLFTGKKSEKKKRLWSRNQPPTADTWLPIRKKTQKTYEKNDKCPLIKVQQSLVVRANQYFYSANKREMSEGHWKEFIKILLVII